MLMRDKASLETELEGLKKSLRQLGVGMKDPLVDSQGFPRSDVDVHGIRIQRNTIIRRSNDHQQVMKKIEKTMMLYHELLKRNESKAAAVRVDKAREVAKDEVLQEYKRIMNENSSLSKAEALKMAIEVVKSRRSNSKSSTSEKDPLAIYSNFIPFLMVERVWPNSPAEEAGLAVQDKIVKFGSINKSNLDQTAMKRIVIHSKGKPLEVIVRRKGKLEKITLTPKVWSGQGLLGCFLKPVV